MLGKRCGSSVRSRSSRRDGAITRNEEGWLRIPQPDLPVDLGSDHAEPVGYELAMVLRG
jgi:hypothetical protein